MRTPLVLALLLAGTVSPATTFAEKETPSKRAKVTCAQYRANVEKTAGQASFDTRIKAGSWGRVPAPLRKLPRRARLCGADGMGQAVIVSPLSGKELEEHYAPLFAKLECQPLTCDAAGEQTRCRCKHQRDIDILVTDTTSEAFVLAFMVRQSPGKPPAPH